MRTTFANTTAAQIASAIQHVDKTHHELKSSYGLTIRKEEIVNFCQIWQELAKTKKLTASHMALRSIVLDRPLAQTFTPITNGKKLANGCTPWQGALAAIRHLTNVRTFPSEFSELLGMHIDEIGSASRSISASSFI